MNEIAQRLIIIAALIIIVAFAVILISFYTTHGRCLREQCRDHGHTWRADEETGDLFCARCGAEPRSINGKK